MEGIQTHPSTAVQAKAFTAPGSLSFPGATHELTPPASNGDASQRLAANGQQAANGNGVTPATPAATPAATQGPSGITPTLQYVPRDESLCFALGEAHGAFKGTSLPRSILIAAWT